MNRRVVLASGNRGKLRELQAMLNRADIECVAMSDLGVPDVPEDGLSFVENALIKARNACRHTGLPAIADDSGLEVDALSGRPGIYSARFAGEGASDADNIQKLLRDLAEVKTADRTARFICALVYMRHAEDPVPTICVGKWCGEILTTARGDNGFGYDPVFLPNDLHRSSAELDAAEKNAISHRANALRCLANALKQNPAD
jgi:XTP/dITP diphosphohydrolase